nr:molybdopterin cofactor-binding domain-containing protein [Pseudomonas fluorescens]
MLNEIFPNELPRALQHSLERDQADGPVTLPRRSFLKIVGIGGLALGAFPHLALAQEANGAAATPLKPTQQPSAFVQIAPDGVVTVTLNRLEFGQGVQTALPMILAEELDADWSLVRSRNGNSDAAYLDPNLGIHLTGGSSSIKNSYTQYRELGARARAMLLAAAAARWNVDVASLSTQAGTVFGPGAVKRATVNWPKPRWQCRCRKRSRSRIPRTSESSARPPRASMPRPRAAASRISASTCICRGNSPRWWRVRQCSAPGLPLWMTARRGQPKG